MSPEVILTSIQATQRQVSLEGSILVVLALLAPFGLAYLVSVYENRLLFWFSEGEHVLPKGSLIGSVLSTVMYPLLSMSFGLFGVAHLVELGLDEEALASGDKPAWAYAVYVIFTLVFSLATITWSRHRMAKKWFQDNLPLQRLYRRWLWWVSWTAQVLLLTFFWLLIAFFPETTSIIIS